MSTIKAILYDMDGVLIEAKDWHYEALNRALMLFGVPINRYDHLVTYDGLPTKNKLEMLTREGKLPAKLHSFISKMKQHYTHEIVYAKCKPVFAHQYALSRLKQEGFRQVVCSNSIRESIQLMLSRAKILDYLEFFLSNQDVTKSKPDPEMYVTAIQRLGLKPEECLILEDNENGLKAAQASGARVMKVNNVHDVTYHNIKSFLDHA